MYKHEDDSFVQMGGTTTIERLRGAAERHDGIRA
jgi:hypothetical protein